jgi:hypothetical protein
MIRAAASALLGLACLLASGAGAQNHGEAEAGPLPSGDGVVEVRVVGGGGEAAAGLDVVLYALPPGGAPGLARGVTDPEGRVAFEQVATDPAIPYLVGVRAAGVPYGQRVTFAAGSKRAKARIELTRADADVSAALLGAGMVRIDRGCDSLEVTESHPITNPTDRVLIVPEDQRQGRAPVLTLELPLQAGPLNGALGMLPEGLERDGRTVRFWGPVYPGTQELEFGYFLPARGADARFEWRFPGGAPEMSWLAPEDGARIRSSALSRQATRDLDGTSYTVLRARPIHPGDEVELTADFAAPEDSRIVARETQIMIELDDALLAANERHDIAVEGDAPLARSAAPLFCLELPPGAEDLRLGTAAMAMGPSSEPSGTLAFHGPVPSGESSFNLSYRLPLDGDTAVFARRVRLEVPLLEMFVSDTGVRPRTERLHRLRPIRNADRNYLHLQGFAIGRDEELRVEFERLPAPRQLSRMATMGFGLLAAGATFAFLLGPLRSERQEDTRAPSRADELATELAAERETVYGVIRDLDEDFETGKLSVEDHAAMRSEMRERAVALMRQERAAADAAGAELAKAPAPVESCAACSEPMPEDARFCPKCGAKKEAAEA